MQYETFSPLNPLGSYLETEALGAPPGVAVSTQMEELLRDLAGQLGLPDAGIVTPWAGRTGDMEWQEISKPDTNIAMFELSDAKLNEATQALFGQQLPFITVLTGDLRMVSELNRILEGSRYDLFQTQAVYQQADSDPLPKILFLHWLRVKDIDEQPQRNIKSMDQVAKDMQGRLYFSQQVPVEGTTRREHPSISFEDAFEMQEPPALVQPPPPGNPNQPPPAVVTIPEVGIDQPVQQQPTPIQTGPARSLVGPVLVGIGVLAATVAVGRAWKK